MRRRNPVAPPPTPFYPRVENEPLRLGPPIDFRRPHEEEGKWAVNEPLLKEMLWREFSGRQFKWTGRGKAECNVKVLAAVQDTLESAGFEDSEDSSEQEDPKELVDFLTLPFGAIEREMQHFVADIGFSLPLLSTIKSAVMLAYTSWGAYKTAKMKREAVKIDRGELQEQTLTLAGMSKISSDMVAISQEIDIRPLFDLGRTSIIDNCSEKLSNDAVEIGGYTFDLVTSVAGPLTTGVNVATAIGRLVWKLRRLYKTWQMTQKVNEVLIDSNSSSDLLQLIKDHALLGCYILNMPDRVINGHFSDVDNERFSFKEQEQILRVLGVKEKTDKEDRERLLRLRDSAKSLIDKAPCKLSDKPRPPLWLPPDPDDDSDAEKI